MNEGTNHITTATEVADTLLAMQNEAKRRIYMRFFKTGRGQYGEGDKFLGVTNPQVRAIVKEVGRMELCEVEKMLRSEWHEVRLCGLLILVKGFEALCKKKLLNDPDAMKERDKVVTFYLAHAECVNNWDLVDLSVHKIIGRWLLLPSSLTDKQETIDRLASSSNLWLQRMSMICTWMTTRHGDPSWCLRYAEMHMHHPHDLMHKAVGWMLREVGKHSDMNLLRNFLEKHIHDMSRTTLRYAIERMSEGERQMWMKR